MKVAKAFHGQKPLRRSRKSGLLSIYFAPDASIRAGLMVKIYAAGTNHPAEDDGGSNLRQFHILPSKLMGLL
jgi:hypothetical protein